MVEQLKVRLDHTQILVNESLSAHTTFCIGGPADVFVIPYTVEELQHVVQVLESSKVDVTILGGGSNVLVLDGGIRGIVIGLEAMDKVLRLEGHSIIASAGVTMRALSEFAASHSLCGLEFAIGIPGTVGGAVFMNAGAYGGEMSGIISTVKTVDRKGCINVYENADCAFAYRKSIFQKNGEIISEVKVTLEEGDIRDIKYRMEDFTVKRESKQPLEWPSAGSTFKRPPGYFAGTLIDETGLKGLSVGDAQVSEKHAGFVVNKGRASARDVLDLIREVQRIIKEKHGVTLEREVRLLGEEK